MTEATIILGLKPLLVFCFWCSRRGIVRTAVFFFGVCLVLNIAQAAPSPEPDRLWQTILEQAGGPGTHFTNQEEAAKAIKTHLDKQEVNLRAFLRAYPNDPRAYSASIRLSGVLAAEARLLKQPGPRLEAKKILAGIEDDPSVAMPIKADAGFARVSQDMDDAVGRQDDAARDTLTATIRAFDMSYPADRRTPGLLTEIATLYDARPTQKKALLDEAASRTTDEALLKRINDDRKRLAQLGNPLDLQLTPWHGGKPLQLSSLHGHVVVVFFWASWSLPALRELGLLQQAAATLSGQPVDYLTISLDTDFKALGQACQAADLHWLVQCDGRGWQGEMVRSLGINSLPTVWVLDRRGNLLTLNARGSEAIDIIQKALAAK